MKISKLDELNDPFEFLSVRGEEQSIRQQFRKMKTTISKTKGIISFSKNWRNPLLWGHYADNHKGVCLGMEIPDQLLNKIIYASSRLEIRHPIDECWMEKMINTKFRHWRYENEHRIFAELRTPDHDGIYYAEFSENLILKEVIFGCRSTLNLDQVRKDLLPNTNAEITFRKVRPAFKTFRIVTDRRY